MNSESRVYLKNITPESIYISSAHCRLWCIRISYFLCICFNSVYRPVAPGFLHVTIISVIMKKFPAGRENYRERNKQRKSFQLHGLVYSLKTTHSLIQIRIQKVSLISLLNI